MNCLENRGCTPLASALSGTQRHPGRWLKSDFEGDSALLFRAAGISQRTMRMRWKDLLLSELFAIKVTIPSSPSWEFLLCKSSLENLLCDKIPKGNQTFSSTREVRNGDEELIQLLGVLKLISLRALEHTRAGPSLPAPPTGVGIISNNACSASQSMGMVSRGTSEQPGQGRDSRARSQAESIPRAGPTCP